MGSAGGTALHTTTIRATPIDRGGRRRARRGTGALLIAALAATSIAVAAPRADTAHASDIVRLDAQHSGRCIDIVGSSTTSGATAMQWQCDSRISQQFEYVDRAAGRMLRNRNSGFCLTVRDASTAAGAPVVQGNCSGASHTLLTDGGNGSLVFVHSGQCLDVSGVSFADGAALVQWPCHGGTNQRFTPTVVGRNQPYPDEGLPAQVLAAGALVGERTEDLVSGVVGYNYANDSFPQTNIRVTAFAEIDDVIYVGGKFTGVLRTATGPQVAQRFLAAFDRNTGTFIDTFRPTLDGNVWDLKATPDGRLLVAGQFSNVNGVANTAAVAMLDATTGAVDPTWRAGVRLTTGSRALVRALDIHDDQVYLAGNFTRLSNPGSPERGANNLGRVSLADGRIDESFRPNIDGVVFDVEATDDRVYAVGNFFYVNGTWSIGETKLNPANGQIVPGLLPQVRVETRNVYNSYLQAVLSMGDEVWYTGAQHMTQVYRTSDFRMLRGFISSPWGDGQAFATLNGIVYKGSHANGRTFEYADTTTYSNLAGWTSRKPMRWIGAWDGTIGGTHDHLDWYPRVGVENGEGGWELFADSAGCLWAGGDFNRGSYRGDTPRFVAGFAKFCTDDTNAPTAPTDPTATVRNGGIDLAWAPSTDDRDQTVRYEILKNDMVFASFVNTTTFRDAVGTPDDRYFVRAMDKRGNRSATTKAFTARTTDASRPTTPQGLAGVAIGGGDVELTWSASNDNFGVVGYRVFRNGELVADVTTTAATVNTPEGGTYTFQVAAYDEADNESFRSTGLPLFVDGPDLTAPGIPRDLAADVVEDIDIEAVVTLTWRTPPDNIGVAGYVVTRNGEVIADDVADTTFVVTALAAGRHDFQVRAFDAAGNVGNATAAVRVDIAGPDVRPPTTPQDLAAVVEANGNVTLTWTAATDDRELSHYVVTRNGVVIADPVGDTTFTVPAPGAGRHDYQVRAVDAVGNVGNATPAVRVDI